MIERKTVSQCVSSDYCKGWNDAVDTMPKWISVKDALPDRQCEYLVRYGFGEPIIQSYSGVMYFVLYDERPHFENDGLYGLKVTHWMPLPEPPKEV